MLIGSCPASIIYSGFQLSSRYTTSFGIKEASELTILGDSIKFIGDIQWKPKQSAMLIFSP